MEIVMEFIYTWIRNIVIYMLLNTVVINLVGGKNYKKYVSIVSGMILVLIVIAPIMDFMKIEDKLDLFLEKNDFSIETSDFRMDLNRMEEAGREAIFAEYEEKIRQQVEVTLAKEKLSLTDFDLKLDQDAASPEFGSVLGMSVTATAEYSNQKEENNRLLIDDIEINHIKISEEETDTGKPPSPLEIIMKKRLSDFYNIEQGNININIQGG
jgi:stage III sporulation protein AF